MTTDALERAARAARDANAWDYSEDADYNAKLYEYIARAVLMAVREPGEDVARSVGRAAWHSGSGQRPENVWAAGIDAILNEGEG